MYSALSIFLTLFIVFLQSLFGPLPLLLLFFILLSVFQKNVYVFFLAIVGGMMIDSITFRPIGVSSLFFLCTVGLIYLYRRKFETEHILFVLAATTISGLLYQFFFTSFAFTSIWSVVILDIFAGIGFGGIMFLRRHMTGVVSKNSLS